MKNCSPGQFTCQGAKISPSIHFSIKRGRLKREEKEIGYLFQSRTFLAEIISSFKIISTISIAIYHLQSAVPSYFVQSSPE